MSVSGGAALTLAEPTAGRGGTWGPDDTIVYSQALESGLYRISATGGTPVELTQLSEGERRHRWPWFLPNGEAVLFMVQAPGASFDDGNIEAVFLDTGERKVLLRGGTYPRYVPPGHLLYVRENTLFAMPFDPNRIEPTGEPSPVLEGVAGRINGGASDYAFSENASLVYVPGGAAQANRRFVWVDREGREEPLAAEPQNYQEFTLSPDGTQLAVRIIADNTDVWIYDLVRDTWTRLTFDPATEATPVSSDSGNWALWAPDGRELFYVGPQAMMGVSIETEPTITLGRREPLFDMASYITPNPTQSFRRVAMLLTASGS